MENETYCSLHERFRKNNGIIKWWSDYDLSTSFARVHKNKISMEIFLDQFEGVFIDASSYLDVSKAWMLRWPPPLPDCVTDRKTHCPHNPTSLLSLPYYECSGWTSISSHCSSYLKLLTAARKNVTVVVEEGDGARGGEVGLGGWGKGGGGGGSRPASNEKQCLKSLKWQAVTAQRSLLRQCDVHFLPSSCGDEGRT